MGEQAVLESEPERVEKWRRDELVRAGYPMDYALKLARHVEVDLRLAVRLLEQGCTPAVAVKILL